MSDGVVKLSYVPSNENVAHVLTKPITGRKIANLLRVVIKMSKQFIIWHHMYRLFNLSAK